MLGRRGFVGSYVVDELNVPDMLLSRWIDVTGECPQRGKQGVATVFMSKVKKFAYGAKSV